jgi:menaquinone-dependent protoporphyrinogen oxidase
MRVLVTYGSKHGGTAGLAEWIGQALEHSGASVSVVPTGEVTDVESYDAVIIGGALYVFRWHTDARRFVRSHATALSHRPVWLFSSGPLDDSATEQDIPPVRSVRKAMDRIGARGHQTFGGRLLPGSKSALPVGDWRDHSHVDRWVKEIVDELTSLPTSDKGITQ